MEDENFFLNKRNFMVTLMKQQGITNPNILRAMLYTERHFFAPNNLKKYSYDNIPVNIGSDQSMIQPSHAAFLLQALDVQEGERVLEIGCGSGYTAALLSKLVGPSGKVYTMEVHRELVRNARNGLQQARCNNVQVVFGNGIDGFKEGAPYDKILISGTVPEFLETWLKQLKTGGTILAPLGYLEETKVIKATKYGNNSLKREQVGNVHLSPLNLKRMY